MRLFSCGESNLYHGQQAGTMTELPASVIRDVVRFIDEVGTDAWDVFHAIPPIHGNLRV